MRMSGARLGNLLEVECAWSGRPRKRAVIGGSDRRISGGAFGVIAAAVVWPTEALFGRRLIADGTSHSRPIFSALSATWFASR